MYEKIEQEIDAYFKRTIINIIKDFSKYESRKNQKEFSIEELSEKLNNDETVYLSYEDNYAVFSLENHFKEEKLCRIIGRLSKEEKEILTLSILEEWTSQEIGNKFNKSDSRIRHIIKDTIQDIKKKYEEE